MQPRECDSCGREATTYDILLPLASGSAGLSRTQRDIRPLLNHGWVTAELKGRYYQWVRITPAGLQAVARAVERYGLPEIGPKPQARRRVCANCGDTRCRFEMIDAEEAMAA